MRWWKKSVRLTSLARTRLGCAWRCIAAQPSRGRVRAASGERRPQRCGAARLLGWRPAASPVPCLPRSSGSQSGNCPSPHPRSGHNNDPPSPGDPGLQPPRYPRQTRLGPFFTRSDHLRPPHSVAGHGTHLRTGSHKHLSDTPDTEGGRLAICFQASTLATSKVSRGVFLFLQSLRKAAKLPLKRSAVTCKRVCIPLCQLSSLEVVSTRPLHSANLLMKSTPTVSSLAGGRRAASPWWEKKKQVSALGGSVPAEAQKACLLICGASLSPSSPSSRCLLSLTLFLTVADVTLPQRGLEALKQNGVG